MTELALEDRSAASRHLSRALELLDEDSSVDPSTRARIEKGAQEALARSR